MFFLKILNRVSIHYIEIEFALCSVDLMFMRFLAHNKRAKYDYLKTDYNLKLQQSE